MAEKSSAVIASFSLKDIDSSKSTIGSSSHTFSADQNTFSLHGQQKQVESQLLQNTVSSYWDIINKIDDLTKKNNELGSKIEESSGKHEALNKEYMELKRRYDALQDTFLQGQTKIIETLGVFFGIFSFISIGVQIYTKVTSLFAASIFTILLFCLLVGIIIIFDVLINKANLKRKIYLTIALVIIFLLVAAYFCSTLLKDISLMPSENTKEFDHAVDLRLNDNYFNKKTTEELVDKKLKKYMNETLKKNNDNNVPTSP